jgi:LysM repeat protein
VADSYDVETHKVVKGDTLGALAKRFGTTIEMLMKLNPGRIRAKDKMIKIGAELIVKAPPPGPPPEKAGGPKQGLGGSGYSYGEEDRAKGINPHSKHLGYEASAPLKEDKWRPGLEDRKRKQVEIPLEIMSQAEAAAPAGPPAPPPVPFGETTLGKVHSWIDPVAVLSGNAGNPNFDPSTNDVLGTALMGLGAGGTAGAPRLGVQPAPPPHQPFSPRATMSVQEAFGRDAAARASRSPTGHSPKQLKEILKYPQRTTSKSPTGEGAAVFKDAKGRDAGRHAEYEGEVIDDAHTFGSNVITEPRLGDPANLSNRKPVGSKELADTPVNLDKLAKVDATSLKTVDDFRNTLRQYSDNTIVLDNAESLGFNSPRVVIHGGDPVGNFVPEHALDAFGTPYLSKSQFLQAIKAAGLK